MKQEVVLDTTYILPLLGLEVNLDEKELLQLQSLWAKGHPNFNFYITSISLMEIQYQLNGIYRNTNDISIFKDYSDFLLMLNNSKIISLINPQKNYLASDIFIDIRGTGHKDLMDCWILASAASLGGIFLTEDSTLKKRIKKHGSERIKQVPFWNWKKMSSFFEIEEAK